jgi:hypothetical protein
MASKGKAGRQRCAPGKDEIARQHRVLSALPASGHDPIGFLCDVLSNESATDEERKAAAGELLPYYHPKLAKMGSLLRRFLL